MKEGIKTSQIEQTGQTGQISKPTDVIVMSHRPDVPHST